MFLSFMASRRGHLFQGLGGLCSEVVLTRDFHNTSQPREFLSLQSDLEWSSNHGRHSLGKQPSQEECQSAACPSCDQLGNMPASYNLKTGTVSIFV